MTSGPKVQRSVTWLVLVATVVVVAGLVPARANAEGSTRTVTKAYIGHNAGPWGMTCLRLSGGSPPPDLGCAYFGRTYGDVVTVTITDESGLPVGGHAVFEDWNGRWLRDAQPFCGTSSPMPVVPGVLVVQLDGPAGRGDLNGGCPIGSAYATKGTVSATFKAGG